jgi:mRNA-degrading endonuclease RelE of RelBE toxin-antitoxin system
MVNIDFHPKFKQKFSKLKDSLFIEKVKKQIKKVIENPSIGKPMRNVRKGTREVYISPFRLSYAFIESENTLILLDLYHKDRQ